MATKKDKNMEIPKKMLAGKFMVDDQEIELNFGLQFACSVDNYKEDIAMTQGIDNIVIVTTSLIKRKLGTLKDLLIYSLQGVVDQIEEVAEQIIDQQANKKGGLDELYTLFFTNVLANKFLIEQVDMNRTLINHIMTMAKLEQEAKEIQSEEVVKMLEKDMEKVMELKKNGGDMEGE